MDPITRQVIRNVVVYTVAKIGLMLALQAVIRHSLKEYEKDQAA